MLVDKHGVATESLTSAQPIAFFEQTYLLPAELAVGKPTVVVRWAPVGGSTAGGVFGVRAQRAE